MLTLFASIKPPKYIINAVAPLQKGIEDVRWIPEDNLHITLGYFGLLSTEFTELLDYELGRNFGHGAGGGFDLRLSGADVFGGERPHTLWLGLQPSTALTALHKHIRSAARRAMVDMETRKFTPHLSLAYMHSNPHPAELERYLRRYIAFKSKPFLVDQFGLYSSNARKNGPNEYIKEANYPLLG